MRLSPVLPLNGLHLIFEPQLELFEADLFQLFVFCQVAFLGECIESLGVLRVLLG